jgi:transketolase
MPQMPWVLGGSADLTPSNNTRFKGAEDFQKTNRSGRYVRYGVREHAMGAVMNGIAVSEILRPYGGTFFVFSDYMRPAVRMAALSKYPTIFVFTHDSIGLGEDGPTHQPVEHMAALRAIPHLIDFRPADAIETAECWEVALTTKKPSVMALTRQNLATLRTSHTDENLSAKGAYELAAADGEAKVTLLATGSEVEIAMAARELLQGKGTPTRVVSMPSWELFEAQPEAYRKETLGEGTVRVAVEAAIGMGWERYTGANGRFVGMHGFGASAPYKDLYQHFGITAEAVAEAAMNALQAAG